MGIFPKSSRRKSLTRYEPGERWRWQRGWQTGRVPRYQLESLEPRILLSATLYDPADGANNGDAVVAESIEANLESLFTKLGEYGEELSRDEAVNETALPFFQVTLNDLFGFDIGDLLKGQAGADSAYSEVVDTFFSGDSDPMSDELAAALQDRLNLEIPSAHHSVTDVGSTDDELVLNFSIDPGETGHDLAFGDEAQEFFMEMGPNAAVTFTPDTVTFTVKADLTGLDNLTSDEAIDDDSDTADYWVEFGGVDQDVLAVGGESSHSNSQDPLTGYGVGFGLVEARDAAGDPGGYVASTGATFDFDIQIDFTLDPAFSADQRWTLTELESVTDWATTYTPETPADTDVSDDSFLNSGELFLPIDVANPAGDTFVSGLGDVTGSFELTDGAVLDDRPPVVQASDPTLVSFARLTPDDLLRYLEGTSMVIGQVEGMEELEAFVPFLEVTLGEAYGFETAGENALYDPLRTVSSILTAQHAPATSGDPLDYSGTASFHIDVATGGTMNSANISVSGATGLDDLIAKLNTALAARGIAGVTARSTGTQSPRIELTAAEGTLFFLSQFSGTLDMGFDGHGLVFARNGGALSDPGGDQSKFTWQGVKVESDTGIEISSWNTPTSFTLQVESDPEVTIEIDPILAVSVSEFADYLQELLADAGLYDVASNEGVTVDVITAGSGFGLEFTHTDGTSVLTIGGSAAPEFHLDASSGTTLTSTRQVAVSPFNEEGHGLEFEVTYRSQDEGALSEESATVRLAAENFTNYDALEEALRDALNAAGLTDFTGTGGVLVDLIPLAGGETGIRLYGSADVYELEITGDPAALAKLGLSGGSFSSAAPWIDLDVTHGTGSSASTVTTRVYLNGNATHGLFSGEENDTVDAVVDDIQDALERAGLLDPGANTGVDFRAIESGGTMTETLEFFARNPGDEEGNISAIATGAASGIDHLDLAHQSSQAYAPSSEISRPNFDSVQTFVQQLNSAVGVPRVEVNGYDTGGGSKDGLQFTAWTVNTVAITIGGGALAHLNLDSATNGTTDVHSQGAILLSSFDVADAASRTLTFSINGESAVSVEVPRADYASVDALGAAIFKGMREAGLHEGLLTSPAVYNGGDLANGVSPYFDFPIRFYYDEFSENEGGLADLTDVDLRFETDYGSTATGRVSDLASPDGQTLSRSAEIELVLSVDLIQPDTTEDGLTVELPVLIPEWDGRLEYDARLQMILDDGVTRDVLVTVEDMEAYQGTAAATGTTRDFAEVLNEKLGGIAYGAGFLSDVLTFSLDTVNDFERDVLLLKTVAGSTRSLVVKAPEYSRELVQVVDEASDKLGFTTVVAPGESRIEFVPVFAADPENNGLDITAWFTDSPPYQMSQDLALALTLPDGTVRAIRVLASDTSGNANWQDLAADVDAALAAAGLADVDAVGNNGSGTLELQFTGTAAVTDTWGVAGGRDIYFGTASDPIMADLNFDADGARAGDNLPGFALETEAFFTIKLPDGTFGVVQVEAADTAENASYDDLLDDINQAILATQVLSDSGALAKVEASFVDDGSGGKFLQFDLNPHFFPQGGTWSLQVGTRYQSGESNALYQDHDLGFPEVSAVESQFAVSGPISRQLTESSDFRLTEDLSFDLSVNGSGYVSVLVEASTTAGNNEIGDLVGQINTALAAATVTLGGADYTADHFVTAGVISRAERIQLRLEDNAPVEVLNVRLDPGSASANSYADELGFADIESRIGMRGSDPRLSNLSLTGKAWVEDGTAAGQGAFGFIDFDFATADVDLMAASELRISGTDRMQDLARALSGYRAEYEADPVNPFSATLGIEDETFARVELGGLNFPGDPVSGLAIGNLEFGPDATITVEYQPKGGGSGARIGVAGTDFDKPGEPDLTFFDTNDTHLLSRLGFDDVVASLWRVGDMLSDLMHNDPDGPFKQKLFFAESGLVDIYDFGVVFNHVVDQIWLNPPENLQSLQRALAIGLQLENGDITIELDASGSGSAYDAAIHIAFELVRTTVATLPLYVDLATLRGRSVNAGLVEQSLLGMSSMAGNPTDPMEVEFSALSELHLDLDIELVEDGTVIQPRPVLNQPADGHFFETRFFLTGDSYGGDIPAGANRLRLGHSWLDNEGNEVVAPGDINNPAHVSVASTRPLSATYDGTGDYATLTATANGALVLDGVELAADDVVLIKDQANPGENGVYVVADAGNASTPWQLTRTNKQSQAGELDWLKVFVDGGARHADQDFMLKAVPSIKVVAVFDSHLNATYQDFTQDGDDSNDHFLPLLTASSDGTLRSGGTAPAEGDFVLLDNQTDPDRNGVYQVINTGSSSSPWKMVQMDVGKSTLGEAVYDDGADVHKYHLLKDRVTGDMAVTVAPDEAPVHVVDLRPSAVAINEPGEVALPDVYGTPAAYDNEAVTVDPDDIVAPVAVEVSTTESLEASYNESAGRLTADNPGAIIIDGEALSLGDRVLVNHQKDGVQNGIYEVTRIGGASQTWQLTRDGDFDSRSELARAKVEVAAGTYTGQRFLQTETLVQLNESVVRFSRLIAPARYQWNLAVPDAALGATGEQSKVLAYQVEVATTGDIDTDPASPDRIADYTDTADGIFIEALQPGSINNLSMKAWSPMAGQEITLSGIDGIAVLEEGNLILVKDQRHDTSIDPSSDSDTYQGHYQNGIYEVVTEGDDDTPWKLQRVDFADDVDVDGNFNADDFIELRISVRRGMFNFDTRWIQTNAQLTAVSAGNHINFSDEVASVYGHYDVNGTLVQPWLDFSADGQAAAALPLTVVLVPEDGGETIISRDLGSLTDDEKKELGQLGGDIVYDDLYESMPDLPTLRLLVPNDNETTDTAFTGSGLEKFFNTSLVAVEFTSLPDLLRTVPPSDVLSLLRDWAYLGDALDLSLFVLQFGMDLGLGVEVPLLGATLPRYAGFIEEFRDDLTTEIRERVRLDPLKPVNAIRDSLYAALGPNGAGYLTDAAEIGIHVEGQSWNIEGTVASGDYGLTPEGAEFEAITGSAVEFSFALVRDLDTDDEAVAIDTIQSGDESIGLSLSDRTNVFNESTGNTSNATGGVHLRRAFEMNFGFGMDVADGYYIFNPTRNDADAGNDKPLIEVTIESELDGDIDTPGVQTYEQKDFRSQLHQLSIRAADARPDYTGLSDGGDGYHSGYFGTYSFDLNTGAVQERIGRNAIGASVDDLRLDQTLGPDTEADSLLNFQLDADADIHLMLESDRDGLIPSYQTDFFHSLRWGSGYSPLIFDQRLAGLGNVSLGNDAWSDTFSGTDKLSQDEWGEVSPAWRFDRQQLIEDGDEGTTFVAYQNISIDVKDYLGGPLYETLKFFDKTIEPLRPFLNFLTSPVPGTEWMATPLMPGVLLGSKFQIFIALVNTIEKLLGQIPKTADFNEREIFTPRVAMAGSYSGILFSKKLASFKAGNQEAKNLYKQARQERKEAAERRKLFDALPDFVDDDVSDTKYRAQKFADAIKNKVNTPNKFSEKFEKFRDRDFWEKHDQGTKGKSFKDKLKMKFKRAASDALKENDDRGGRKGVGSAMVGGGFQLDALRKESALAIFTGHNADLLRVTLPNVSVKFAYTRFFPLPAFPPLGMTVGFAIGTHIQLSMGWDTTGFYWTTKDANGVTMEESNRISTFGFWAEFSVGVALNFGFIEAGVEAFLKVGVEFYWNTPENSDKLRQDEIDWLWGEGRSLFDVEVYGTVGVRIYVDLTVPIPFVGPITLRLFEHTVETDLFRHLFDAESGYIQLAEQDGDTLRLNMGRYADERLFLDRFDRNETFHVYHLGGNQWVGETVVVHYAGYERDYYSKFTGVKEIYGYAGDGATEIDAGANWTLSKKIELEEGGEIDAGTTLEALQFAAVSFFGGSGSTYLRAGTRYEESYARSRLQGGTTTATLVGGETGLDLVAAGGNTVIEGSTGSDRIVSGAGSDTLRGNGGGDTFYFHDDFGRDRIYVTGDANAVDFGGVVLSGHAGSVDSYSVGAHTADGTKFQFGPLVQSVKQENNTAFFAVDPGGADSIDRWVGTDGDDIFNVFFFAPNKILDLDGGQGENFYNVFLGDPKKVYDKDPAVNTGTIEIDDTEGQDGYLLLNQTYADTISYNSTMVDNGREQMTMSGLERIDLNAGDSTLIWGGDPGANGYEQILGGNITTGRILVVGKVQLTGQEDVHLDLLRTLDVAHHLVVANADDGSPRNLTIEIENPNPLLTSDLYIGAGAGIFLNEGTGVTTPGTGYGTITLKTPAGSIDNSPAESGGVVQVDNGFLEMSARDSIGAAGKPLFIRSERVTAQTTGNTNASGLQGIYLTSDRDINVRGNAESSGLMTLDGAIHLDVAAGAKLTYGEIDAGGGRDITIVADEIELAGGYSYSQQVQTQNWVSYPVVSQNVVYVYKPVLYTYNFFGFLKTYYKWMWVPVVREVTSYINVLETEWTTEITPVAAGSGSLTGTGQLVFLNQTDESGIEVGNGSPSANPGTLSLTRGVLDSLADGFSNIVIGRASDDTRHTGRVDIRNYEFQDPVTFRGGAISAGLAPVGVTDPGVLSSTDVMNFDAYDHDTADAAFTGTLTFDAGGSYRAQSLSAKSDADLTADGTFVSTATADGLLLFEAGQNTNEGSVTLAGSFQTATAGTGSDLRAVTGSDTGDILIKNSASFLIDDLVSLVASNGTITQEGGGRITVDNLEVIAAGSIDIRTRILDLVNAFISGTGDFTIDEYDSLNLVEARAADGDLNFLVGAGADAAGSGDLLFIDPDSASGTDTNITASGHTVTIDAAGTVRSATSIDPGEWHVEADKLVVDSRGRIDLVTDLEELVARANSGALTQGNIVVSNTGAAGETFLLGEVRADNGSIRVTNSHDMQADLVQTNFLGAVESINHTITLETETGGDGTLWIGEVKTRGDADATPGGHADVTLDADGLILRKSAGTSLVTSRDLFATAHGEAILPATDAINLNISSRELIAKTARAGDVVIASPDDLTIRLVERTGGTGILGDFHVTLDHPLANPELSIERIDVGSHDVHLDVDGAVLDLDSAAQTKIVGRELHVTAGGNTILDTAVGELFAEVGGTGSLTVEETDNLNLMEVTTAGGPMEITVGIDDAVPGDNLFLTSGNVFIGQVRSGTLGDQDMDITPYGGAIRQITDAALLAKFTGAPFLAGGLLTADTWRGMGDTLTALNTNLGTLVLETRQPGVLNIIETDQILLDDVHLVDGWATVEAGTNILVDELTLDGPLDDATLTAHAGFIRQTTGKTIAQDVIARAASGIELLTDIDALSAWITGAGGDIRVNEDDSITLNEVNTPAGILDIEVGVDGTDSRIDVSAGTTLPTPHVTATDMILTTQKGVALASGYLNADVSVIEATASLDGGIYIHNLRDVELRRLLAHDGEIRVSNVGDILATDVRTDLDDEANDIHLSSTPGSGGDITLNYIGAGQRGVVPAPADPGYLAPVPGSEAPLYTDVTIDADGAIEGVAAASRLFDCHILAETVTYVAETGIGNRVTPIVTGRVLSATTTTGDMTMGAATDEPFVFKNSSTGDGNIGLVQTGSGSVRADNISSGNGSVSIASNGGGGLTANDIRSNNGSVNLTSRKGGNTAATNIRAINGTINIINSGGGDQTVDGLFTRNGNINLTVGTGGILTVFESESRGGSSKFIADSMEFLGGPESIKGTGNLTLSAFSPTRLVNIDAGFAGPPGQESQFLQITNRELKAISSSFASVLVGNPAGLDLSFQTFQAWELFGAGAFFGDGDEPAGQMPEFDEPYGASTYVRLVDLLFPGTGGEDGTSGGSGDDDEEMFTFALTRSTGNANPFDQMDATDGSGGDPGDDNENGDGQNGTGEGDSGNAISGNAPVDGEAGDGPVAGTGGNEVAVWTAGSLILFPVVKGVQWISKAGRAARKIPAMLGLF